MGNVVLISTSNAPDLVEGDCKSSIFAGADMKTMRLFFAMTALMSGSILAGETEEARAKEACMIVVERLNIQPELCDYNVRTEAFWQCTGGRMDEGEGVAFASERCKNIIKHRGASGEHGERE